MKIRDKNTSCQDFRHYARRLMTVICEEALGCIATESTISTPVDSFTCTGPVVDQSNIVAVSIIRAADSMLDTFMSIVPEASVGKILIQRDEATAEPRLFYSKLPSLAGKQVILLDPMLATGGSAQSAVDVLIKAGAEESKIMFISVLGCPEGVAKLEAAFPSMKIFAGKVDSGLTARKYIWPGLGDFGDRFFGTV